MEEVELKLENVATTTIHNKKWYIPYQYHGSERIIDWGHEIWKENPSVGEVIIEAIRKDIFLNTKLKPFTDEDTGVHIGLGSGIFDPNTKRPMLSGYKFSKISMTLDLADIKQRKLALFIILNPMIRNSPNAFSQTLTTLIVKDEISSIVEEGKRRKLRSNALELIAAMDDEEVEGMARITVGVKVSSTPLMIRSSIEEYAENNPEGFIQDVEQQDRSYKINFQRALDMGIVEHSLNKGYMFNAIALGRDKFAVIEYLKEHASDIYSTMSRDIEAQQMQTKKVVESDELKAGGSNAAVIAERDEYKEKFEKLQAEMLEKKDTNLSANVEENSEGEKDVNDNPLILDKDEDQSDFEKMTFTQLKNYALPRYPNEEFIKFKSTADMLSYVKSKQ